jgi:hypothetical protein
MRLRSDQFALVRKVVLKRQIPLFLLRVFLRCGIVDILWLLFISTRCQILRRKLNLIIAQFIFFRRRLNARINLGQGIYWLGNYFNWLFSLFVWWVSPYWQVVQLWSFISDWFLISAFAHRLQFLLYFFNLLYLLFVFFRSLLSWSGKLFRT